MLGLALVLLCACEEAPVTLEVHDVVLGRDGTLTIVGLTAGPALADAGLDAGVDSGVVVVPDAGPEAEPGVWVSRAAADGTEQWRVLVSDTARAPVHAAETVTERVVIAFGSSYAALTANGELLWQRSLAMAANPVTLTAVAPLDEGGALIVGHALPMAATATDLVLLAVDSDGWALRRRVLRPGFVASRVLRRPSASGFLIVGAGLEESGDVHVAAVAADGALEWYGTVGTPVDDRVTAAVVTRAGGLLVAATTGPVGGEVDLLVAELGPAGELRWHAVLEARGNEVPGAILESDGYVTVASAADGFGGDQGDPDVWLVSFDGSGAVRDQRAVGGGGRERPLALTEGRDGLQIIVAVEDAVTHWTLPSPDVVGARSVEGACGQERTTGALLRAEALGGAMLDGATEALADTDLPITAVEPDTRRPPPAPAAVCR